MPYFLEAENDQKSKTQIDITDVHWYKTKNMYELLIVANSFLVVIVIVTPLLSNVKIWSW